MEARATLHGAQASTAALVVLVAALFAALRFGVSTGRFAACGLTWRLRRRSDELSTGELCRHSRDDCEGLLVECMTEPNDPLSRIHLRWPTGMANL